MARPSTQADTRPSTRPSTQARTGGAKAASQPKARAISPRSKNLIAGVAGILEPYNYTEADIQTLVKSCGYDAAMLQEKVMDILEAQQEQNPENWDSKMNKNEKAEKAQLAKERRLQREKDMAEEAARTMAERTKKEDEKYRNLQKELKDRQSRAKAAMLGGPNSAPEEKKPAAGWGTSGADGESAEAEQTWPEQPVQEEEVAEEAQNEWIAPAGGTPSAPSRPSWQPEASAESWTEAPSQAPAVPVPEAPMPMAAPTAAAPSLPHWALGLGWDDAVLKSSNVQMPPSYDLLLGSGPEPDVYFGSLHVDDTSAVPSSPPVQPAAAPTEAPSPAKPVEQRSQGRRPPKGSWVPREAQDGDKEGDAKPRGRKGGRRGGDGSGDAEQANGEGDGSGHYGGGKERKKGWGKKGGKGEGKGEGKKSDGKGSRKGKGSREDWQGGKS